MLILVSIFGPSPVCAEHVFSFADLRKDHSDVDIETVVIAYGLIRWMATKKDNGRHPGCGVHPQYINRGHQFICAEEDEGRGAAGLHLLTIVCLTFLTTLRPNAFSCHLLLVTILCSW